MPLKLLGLSLIVAGFLLRRGVVKAHRLGYVGSSRRRIHRNAERFRFNMALGSQAIGALICFVGAFICLSHTILH